MTVTLTPVPEDPGDKHQRTTYAQVQYLFNPTRQPFGDSEDNPTDPGDNAA